MAGAAPAAVHVAAAPAAVVVEATPAAVVILATAAAVVILATAAAVVILAAPAAVVVIVAKAKLDLCRSWRRQRGEDRGARHRAGAGEHKPPRQVGRPVLCRGFFPKGTKRQPNPTKPAVHEIRHLGSSNLSQLAARQITGASSAVSDNYLNILGFHRVCKELRIANVAKPKS
jgi:hypothetical protein